MNNILFGSIGVLMLGIIGLGFAEVKYQAHGGEFAAASQQESVSEVTGDTSAVTDQAPTVLQGETAGAGLSQAAAKVTAAYTGTWDARDDDGDDEGDDEDREESDDRDERSAPATVATQPARAAPTNTPTAPAPSASSFTMAQIAAHNSAASCYSVINGNVYDLTSFVSRHPGGATAIKSLCGVDGTAAYNGQHGSSGRPANELASLKIGVLAQ